MPQMLALYKEVEAYYYGGDGVKGLRDWDALDDTILLLADDNFANVRTLPTEKTVTVKRAGDCTIILITTVRPCRMSG